MFFWGNFLEKFRMVRLDCRGEVVVDFFAGIGYFILFFFVRYCVIILFGKFFILCFFNLKFLIEFFNYNINNYFNLV